MASEDSAVLATPEGSEDYWRRRHEGRPDWAESYWQSAGLPHRSYLLRALRRLALTGFTENFLEFGCNVGVNLELVWQHFPGSKRFGVDINDQALAYGRERFADLSRRWGASPPELLHRSLYDLDSLPTHMVDVVFTCGTLIHVPPTGIAGVLASARRIASQALVLCELHAFTPEQESTLARPGKWCRDYWSALAPLATPEQITIEALPPDVGWDTNARDGQRYRSVNAVVTVER